MKNYLILKNICKKVYLSGSGDFWFEEGVIGDDKSLKYIVLSTIFILIYLSMTALEILAVFAGGLPKDEKNDSITFAVSHTFVLIKIFSVMYNRELVKKLTHKMVQICEAHEDEERGVENYRTMKMNVYAYIITVYGCVTCYVSEGLRKMLSGSHFITIVTYWPFYEDNSWTALAFRLFTTVVLYLLMVTMISIDAFVMFTLIMYKYKFVTLRRYFKNLRVAFDRNNYAGNEKTAADQLHMGLIDGIVMHRNLLSISKDIDQCFGTVLALQVFLSSGSAVTLLLQIAVSNKFRVKQGTILSNNITVVAGLKVILFVIGLFLPLALFLCNAGEITYQASLISDSIFYCGWHASVMRRDLRQLVLLACTCAQRPLLMKAFKMLELTYGTFLLVVRSTYSVFALFYAQNK